MSVQSLLVVLAHPDDESFPLGGTLAKYAAEGVRVVLVSATRGEAGIPGVFDRRSLIHLSFESPPNSPCI